MAGTFALSNIAQRIGHSGHTNTGLAHVADYRLGDTRCQSLHQGTPLGGRARRSVCEPEHLLRAIIGVGFRRARMKYGYALLRGKDLVSGDFSAERRDHQFATLREAQAKTLHLTHWHDFFKCIQLAGYRGAHMISSRITVICAYIFYLLGRLEYPPASSLPDPQVREQRSSVLLRPPGRPSLTPTSRSSSEHCRTIRGPLGGHHSGVLMRFDACSGVGQKKVCVVTTRIYWRETCIPTARSASGRSSGYKPQE